MTTARTHIAAPPGQLYWRHEVCPHAGAKVLLLTVGGTCVEGRWYGPLGYAFTAWCPLPKATPPATPPDIRTQPLWARIKFSLNLIFRPLK